MFLSQAELNQLAIDESTKELEKLYRPTHQEGSQIKKETWKEVILPPTPHKRTFPAPPNLNRKQK